jgi:hypothetical protein
VSPRRRGSLAAQAVFAALAVATIGAFFITTRLKRSTPVVERLTFGPYVSPNDDGRREFVTIGFRTKRSDDVTMTVISAAGDEVRVLARDRDLDAGRHRIRWYGRTAAGTAVPDGAYRVRIALRHEGRSVTSRREVTVDTKPPSPFVRYVTPDAISPDGPGGANRARLRFAGPLHGRPTLLVYRTDVKPPRLVARRAGPRGTPNLSWDGHVGLHGRGRPAPPGTYLLAVRTRDAAGNLSRDPLPRSRREVRGHPGVEVRYVAATAPRDPVRAGRSAVFSVQTDGRRYRYALRRLGSPRALKRGSSRASVLRVHVPRVRSGVFVLTFRVGARRYRTPFAVQGERRAPLAVALPLVAWHARNPVDANGDGFPDLLPLDSEVTLDRPFAGSGLPARFASGPAASLASLDAARVRYDVTTDLALAAGAARPPVRYRGIFFLAPPNFYSDACGRLVRGYVEAGGRVAWAGTGGFSIPVVARGGALALAPSARSATNLFGERLRELRSPASVTVLSDRIGFFAGVGGAFGPLATLEETATLPRGARLLASAGSDVKRPALVVYRYARGVVARLGADGLAAPSAAPSGERIMRRLWTLLSR